MVVVTQNLKKLYNYKLYY